MNELNKKSEIDILKDKLFYSRKNSYKMMDDNEIDIADDFCKGYIDFLNTCRTEREAVCYIKEAALNEGYVPFSKNVDYNPGDKVFYEIHNKSLILCTFGQRAIEDGLKIIAAHIDSPRLDLKPNPVYEDNDIAYFKTHYYGGIKKYQWPCIPLALHGVICKENGETVTVRLGYEDDEPCFTITDLLPHLDRDASKPIKDAIKGESLNILIGSKPFCKDEGSELVKLNILNLLFEKYEITEEDFISAELELVPAFPAKEIGFDRSMIGSYGHDDRVCAYPEVMAEFATLNPIFTTVCVVTDKEETGSDGNTGLQSQYLEQFIEDLAKLDLTTGRDIIRNSKCLSADVNAAFDPTYPSVHDKLNAAYINKGIAVTKYTGGGGKGSTNDANAEFMLEIRKLFNDNSVCWQTGELGKVDEGGGGTVAKYIANLGVQVVDVGVPVLSMHSPYEVVAKNDVYMAYKGFKAFLEN